MANRDYIVFDFETGSRNPHKTQPTQIAALALDGRNLSMKGTFNSEIRPILNDEAAVAAGLDPIEDGALKVTGKNRKDLAKAPTLKSVWKKFCTFVDKYNWKKDPFFNPIPVGFNIIGFDMIIVNRLCKEYGPFDDGRQQQKIFSKIHKCDVMDNMHMWTEGDPSIRSISMDTLRERMGLSKENAHDALKDVEDTAMLLCRFMRLYRRTSSSVRFKGAFGRV